jgi:hypothetical protein
VFPPPQSWKQIAAVDPEKEYVAFTSRLFLKSPLRLPAFLAQSPKITKQVRAAPGIVGWSLGMNLPTLEFYTLSAWENAESLRAFVHAGAHGETVKQFEQATRRPSIFVQFRVAGRELPLRWDDAIARQNETLRRPASAG